MPRCDLQYGINAMDRLGSSTSVHPLDTNTVGKQGSFKYHSPIPLHWITLYDDIFERLDLL